MKCFECEAPAQCDHHVIPKSLGGTKTVPLCRPCHSKVHNQDLVSLVGLQRQGKAQRKSNGGYIGGRVAFGYRSIEDPESPTRKIKVRDEDEQGVISDLSKWIAKGETYEGWVIKMTARGIHKNASAWHKIHKREL